jgi:Phosphoglyceromutase
MLTLRIFLVGKVDIQLPQETRVLIPSIKVKTYVDHPCMSAPQITEKIVESLQHPAYFYLINYANADMVGHSGNFEATVKACQCLDQQLKILYEEIVEKRGGTIFLTGDHGNAEEKFLPNGEPKTSHTINPVPCMIINKSYEGQGKEFQNEYGLADIAPTILQILGLSVPKAMNRGILTVDSED